MSGPLAEFHAELRQRLPCRDPFSSQRLLEVYLQMAMEVVWISGNFGVSSPVGWMSDSCFRGHIETIPLTCLAAITSEDDRAQLPVPAEMTPRFRPLNRPEIPGGDGFATDALRLTERIGRCVHVRMGVGDDREAGHPKELGSPND